MARVGGGVELTEMTDEAGRRLREAPATLIE